MALPRFFCETPLRAHHTLELPDALAHHALRVLRLKHGARVLLFDGQGGQYEATLLADGAKALAQTGAHQAMEAELPGRIILAQGIASGDKMDWIVEKAVELGAHRLAPIAARRSVLQLSGERLAKRRRHWQRIAQSASEQCGRNRLMEVDEPRTLDAWLAAGEARGLVLLCHPEAALGLDEALARDDARDITLLVGPEGGWSPDELALADRHGAVRARFGPRVLRTETAGLALMAAVSALRGWN